MIIVVMLRDHIILNVAKTQLSLIGAGSLWQLLGCTCFKMNDLCFIIHLLEYVIIGIHLDLSTSRSVGIHINLILFVYVLTQVFIG